MENLPIYVYVIFILTTALTVFFFYKASQRSKRSLIVLLVWLAIQMIVSLSGFYENTTQMPPRFLLLIGIPLLFIIVLFSSLAGRRWMDRLDGKFLTLLHIVRVPVELVLFWLFLNKAVPELMTFSGRNLDILSGLTAPFIYYFGYVRKQLSSTIILLWNFVCLLLLFNIVIHAVLSAPFPFQQLAFEQPNIAVLYFPFTWLPACIVPVVLFAHLVSIRKLLLLKRGNAHEAVLHEAGMN
jgi:hypothetical protein